MNNYHQITMSRMCAVGQSLRARALLHANRIQNDAWMRETIKPAERSAMIAAADAAQSKDYSEAWADWQVHAQTCEACKGALR